jgi:uncharacterized membrane protein YccC
MPTLVLATGRPDAKRLARALRSAVPALLFGLRLWAAVCLALYIAFWLQLDNPSWAGASAAIVCQPSLGASLRKGWFRLVGTVVGAVAIVVLTACFPQDRIGFLLGMAVWGAACGLVATLLRNFAAYAAALAGYTAAIIAIDELGATGGASGPVFILAVTRASEICIGIICAGVVLAATDYGRARHRLAAQLAGISAEIAGGFASTFLLAGPVDLKTRPVERDLLRRVIALCPVIDEAFGEDTELRLHGSALKAATDGLFAVLSGWRIAALHLEQLPTEQARREAELIQRNLPPDLFSATGWAVDPSRARSACAAAARALTALQTAGPSGRSLADRSAEALLGLRRALGGVELLADPTRAFGGERVARLFVPDFLPALVNALRVFLTIVALELFWIATAWPNGAEAVTFGAICVILFSPRADQAYAITMSFLLGAGLTAVLAAIVEFAVLPGVSTFAGFSLAIGFVLAPAGALMTQPWQTPMFTAIGAIFVPLLAPANQMTYDTQQFYNSAVGIVLGLGVGALAFRLLPPLSPALRTRRLLALTLRDLRRLATSAAPQTRTDWERRVYSRLSALPEQAEPLQRAELLAALSTGIEIIRLRRIARRFDLQAALDPALSALARGDGSAAIEQLGRLDRMLAGLPRATPGARARLRARGSILAMSESLARHAAYFDSGSAR